MADTNELIGAGMPALQASLLGDGNGIRSTFNGAGVVPASQTTAGFEITSNYSSLGEVDFWNLVNNENSSREGFFFRQKTGSATSKAIAAVYSTSTFGQFDVYSPTESVNALLNATSTAATVGSDSSVPLNINTSGSTRAVFGAAGGFTLATGAFGIPTSTPSAANAAGVTGTIAWDSGFLYVCINTNTWKRVAIATWP
jgi:hypothetical protein